MPQERSRSGGSARGFASMDARRQREIASQGGRASHQKGTAHEFTPDEARAAGRKGGEIVSRDRAHMAEIGRQGGRASHSGRHKKGPDSVAPVATQAVSESISSPAAMLSAADNHAVEMHASASPSSDLVMIEARGDHEEQSHEGLSTAPAGDLG